ncbi:MAG: hypothetical protein GY925_26390 [Actinomycetia bacterium]|nr:hypothetical protein [Actinomycetes bacterium]
MASIASADIGVNFRIHETSTIDPTRLRAVRNVLGNTGFAKKLKNGTSNGQIDKGYMIPITIGASATLSYDVNAGGLVDAEGTGISLAELVGMILINFNTAGSVTMRQPAANGVAGVFNGANAGLIAPAALGPTDPGIGLWYGPAGVAVVAATGDLVELVNNDASNGSSVYWGFIGRSA